MTEYLLDVEFDEDVQILCDGQRPCVYYQKRFIFFCPYMYANLGGTGEIGMYDLFFSLCHREARKRIKQKKYDEIFSLGLINKLHEIINYLVIKHDLGIIVSY